MAATPKRQGDRPETMRQAHTWENVKRRYEAAGLCGGCAGQVAYGHQLGFAKINDPCPACRSVVIPGELIKRHGDRAQRWLAGHWAALRAARAVTR